ncbi:MAG: hypothetical protein COV91_01320 [Candidatus Taylorbacteria bacterium CG11_big_fil_rev_8_21_14_0_20_46_11]|uniref:RelA/SpoT domain-containing protein n=1 Tax=Candidatus Taylorbacteria bacterium CG11_big_fil_rev_8_21_14_0_20_46_11 TaxID=1975025 RepID=A0A2H0KCG0_9BACT|nr:MAG: hypothetical protein COV91_01320 [Candidatus Taylorbacteria bacterium CG11_big_fil_rev_8_21_14_0_20_46_11]
MVPLKEIILATRSLDDDKKALIGKAYTFVEKVHKNNSRHYSTDIITDHISRVALILAHLGMAHESIITGLLHHILREGNATLEEIQAEFGEGVALLVERATVLRDIKYYRGMKHVESLRKLFVASAKDIRILIIKLADRLDSMRHLHLNNAHHKRIARETMEMYVPIAYRLGLRGMTKELEDLAFRYLDPKTYNHLKAVIQKERKVHEKQLDSLRQSLEGLLSTSAVREPRIDTRLKGIYSLYTKMLRRENDIRRVYDLLAIRICVKTIEECYSVLGIIHSYWRPLPGRIKDYIASPKTNGYKGLHTTIFAGNGMIVEVQIRTHQMHDQAEYGLASHIAYKERAKGTKDPYYSWFNQFLTPDNKKGTDTRQFSYIPDWLKEIVHMHADTINESQIITVLRSDFFQKRMFVFDIKGDVVDLPLSATVIDFAFELDPALGRHLQDAKVNGTFAPLTTELHNGDIVEILTGKALKPDRQWLASTKTALARREIEDFLFSDST